MICRRISGFGMSFNPIYILCKWLWKRKLAIDVCEENFGLRQLGTKGTQITVNGRPVFFRGTLECCIFPKTGFPPTDEAEWKRIMEVCQAHGLNHIRFHSWCPPEAAFSVADKLGMYLYVECGAWASDWEAANLLMITFMKKADVLLRSMEIIRLSV